LVNGPRNLLFAKVWILVKEVVILRSARSKPKGKGERGKSRGVRERIRRVYFKRGIIYLEGQHTYSTEANDW